ncbi:hypothetical protein M7I_1701 [Glarea lozoyensis 74030]|uniref:Uncharacterized protein n=1 Tax=Glarea lozoyensis (strain ATCC 74030 / MF5533) TaxID=1104152 RepID=H0EGT1_GLAL7|nr:hypothetical protein M7I_1701 [Glarea lozoyensis 74030]
MAVQRIVPAFQGIDDATAALILQLLLQDSEELAASGAKGKDRAGTSASDSELAVLLYQQELKKSEQFVNDRQVAAHLDPCKLSITRKVVFECFKLRKFHPVGRYVQD